MKGRERNTRSVEDREEIDGTELDEEISCVRSILTIFPRATINVEINGHKCQMDCTALQAAKYLGSLHQSLGSKVIPVTSLSGI